MCSTVAPRFLITEAADDVVQDKSTPEPTTLQPRSISLLRPPTRGVRCGCSHHGHGHPLLSGATRERLLMHRMHSEAQESSAARDQPGWRRPIPKRKNAMECWDSLRDTEDENEAASDAEKTGDQSSEKYEVTYRRWTVSYEFTTVERTTKRQKIEEDSDTDSSSDESDDELEHR